MLPHLGAGIRQGIEDVLVPCRLLSEPQTNATNIQVRVHSINITQSLVLT
jgi:hypothetical protein